MKTAVQEYLAKIGAKGGKISRRVLTTEQARAMVKARVAKQKQPERKNKRGSDGDHNSSR